ncbi:hypothetical protein ACF07O_34560 [Streptomyces althioticus]|uniref:hypothetical protein n=1 Tax=Streptomyces TaxID=1883 RepID=UPI0033C20A10
MKRVIIQQSTMAMPGGFLLTTTTADEETGEITEQQTIVKSSFAWDSAIEGAFDDAVKIAENKGATDIQIDSPFYEAIKARRQMLDGLREGD